jgi:hypothetical protein
MARRDDGRPARSAAGAITAALGPRWAWLLVAAAGVGLVAHSLAFNFVTDDAYISFVYARNLAEHGELVFNLGDRVEGYTSFLWTAILAGLLALGIPPELAARALGTACALGTLVVTTRAMGHALSGPDGAARAAPSPWAALPALLLAAASGFACWSSGGLETQLFTLLITAALGALVAAAASPAAARGQLRRAAAAIALAAMTRPEGPVLGAALGAAWIAFRVADHRAARRAGAGAGAGAGARDELVAAAVFLALWAPWFAWRWWYYGWPFPNTYYVKAAGEWADAGSASPVLASQMREAGLFYVWTWLRDTGLWLALPLVALGLAPRRPASPRGALALGCCALTVVYLPYAVAVGGDFMGLHRFIMPMFVVAAIAVALGLHALVGRARAAVGAAAAVGLLGAFVVAQVALTRRALATVGAERGIDTPGYLIAYTEDRAKIGRALAPCLRSDDFSIVGGAGAQPYYGRMRAIDVFGLVSERVAHEEPRRRARPGHTKWASDRLLAEHDPTLVLSCYLLSRQPPTGEPPPELAWCASFWLARDYELVTLEVPGLVERGTFYTFLAKRSRGFACPGRVR